MIVCLCRAVSDRTIRALVKDGATTVEAIGQKCGAGTGCGGCRRQIAALIASELQGTAVAQVAAPAEGAAASGGCACAKQQNGAREGCAADTLRLASAAV